MIRCLVQVGTLAVLVSFVAAAAANVLNLQEDRELRPVEKRTVTLIILQDEETRSLRAKSGVRIKRIEGFDQKLLHVAPVKGDPKSLAVSGQSHGYTQIILTDENGNEEELFVVVGAKRSEK
jgi:hypothetical protein